MNIVYAKCMEWYRPLLSLRYSSVNDQGQNEQSVVSNTVWLLPYNKTHAKLQL